MLVSPEASLPLLKNYFKNLHNQIARECKEAGLEPGNNEFWTSHPKYSLWGDLHDQIAAIDPEWMYEFLEI